MLLVGTAAAAAIAVPFAGIALWSHRSAAPGRGLPDPAAAGSAAAQLEAGHTFTDVPADHPAAAAMAWAHATEVLTTGQDGSFAPQAEVTRGDLALALHRFAGAPAPSRDGVPALLTDVPEDPEHAAAVLWLQGRGALWGDAELRIHPDAPATFEASRGIVTALLGPALTGANSDAAAVLDTALTAATDAMGSRAGNNSNVGSTSNVGSNSNVGHDGAAPLTRAALAATLHSVDQALTS